MTDVAMSRDSNIRKEEHEKSQEIPRTERGNRKDWRGEGNDGANSDQGSGGCNPQDLCPEEHNTGNSEDPAQNPQAPRSLIEELSSKEVLHEER